MGTTAATGTTAGTLQNGQTPEPPRRGGRDKTLSDRLAALGWGGVPFQTAFVHLVWQYLAARLDARVPLLLIGDRPVRDARQEMAQCRRAALAMILETERQGMPDLLRLPCVRQPEEMLAIIERVYGM